MSQPDYFNQGADTAPDANPQQDSDTEQITDVVPESPKRKIPQKVIVGAAVALCVFGFWGYKKMTKPSTSFATEVSRSATAEGGMLAAKPAAGPVPQQSQFPMEESATRTPSPQSTFSAPPGAASTPEGAGNTSADLAAAGVGAPSTDPVTAATPRAVASPTPLASETKQASPDLQAVLDAIKAQGVQLDAVNSRIAKLEGQGPTAETQSTAPKARATAKAKHVARDVSSDDKERERVAGVVRGTKSTGKGKRDPKEETQVGYKIKQVIPGQAWLEDENGKQYVKTKGDKLGGSEILEIDPDKYIVRTTAGTIR